MATNTLEAGLRMLGQEITTRDTVERAIAFVVSKEGISRPEAFRRIQQLTLTMHKPLVTIAQALLEIGDGTRATD